MFLLKQIVPGSDTALTLSNIQGLAFWIQMGIFTNFINTSNAFDFKVMPESHSLVLVIFYIDIGM